MNTLILQGETDISGLPGDSAGGEFPRQGGVNNASPALGTMQLSSFFYSDHQGVTSLG